MKFVYLLNSYGWEDNIIILNNEQAIKMSLEYPNSRVEIFSKNADETYTPTYCYYKKGELIQTDNVSVVSELYNKY